MSKRGWEALREERLKNLQQLFPLAFGLSRMVETLLKAETEEAYKRGLIAGRSQAGYRERRELPGAKLTPYQMQIARLVAQGMSNPEIAQQLDRSLDTVKTHLRRVYKKTGVHTRSRLAVLLIEHGQDRPEEE